MVDLWQAHVGHAHVGVSGWLPVYVFRRKVAFVVVLTLVLPLSVMSEAGDRYVLQ